VDLIRDSYTFAEFTNRWATELGSEPRDIAVAVAKAIHVRCLKYNTDGLSTGAPSNREPIPYRDDPQAQALDVAIEDHIWRVSEGRDLPNYEDLLRYVALRRDDLENWLSTMGHPTPRFMCPPMPCDGSLQASEGAEPGERKIENVHKVVAILAILLAETGERYKFKNGNGIKKQEIVDEIEHRLASDKQLAELLGHGLGRATLNDVLKRALDPLQPWLGESKDDA